MTDLTHTVKVIGEIFSIRTFDGIEYAAVRVGRHIIFARLVDVHDTSEMPLARAA